MLSGMGDTAVSLSIRAGLVTHIACIVLPTIATSLRIITRTIGSDMIPSTSILTIISAPGLSPYSAAAEELKLSYSSQETLLFRTYQYFGNLIQDPYSGNLI